jgi:hypothetical protein
MKIFLALLGVILFPAMAIAAPSPFANPDYEGNNYGCRVEGYVEEIDGGKNRLHTAISYTLSMDMSNVPFIFSMQTESGSLGSYSGTVYLSHTNESVNPFERSEVNRNIAGPLHEGEAILTPEFFISGNPVVQIGASLNGVACTPLTLQAVDSVACHADGALTLLDTGKNLLQYSLIYDVSSNRDDIPFSIEVVNNAGQFDSKSGTDNLYSDARLVVLYQGTAVQNVTIPAGIKGDISINASLGGSTCTTKQLTLLELSEVPAEEEAAPENMQVVEAEVISISDSNEGQEEVATIPENMQVVEAQVITILEEQEAAPAVEEEPEATVVSSPFLSTAQVTSINTPEEIAPTCRVIAEGSVQENGDVLLGTAIAFEDFATGEHNYRLVGYSENNSTNQTQYMDETSFSKESGVLLRKNMRGVSFPMIFTPQQQNDTFVVNAMVDSVVCQSALFVASVIDDMEESEAVFPSGLLEEEREQVQSLGLVLADDDDKTDTRPPEEKVEKTDAFVLSASQLTAIIIVAMVMLTTFGGIVVYAFARSKR